MSIAAIVTVCALALIAALWFFSRWAARGAKRRTLRIVAAVLSLFCLGLLGRYLIFNDAVPWHSAIPRSLVEDVVLPSYVLLPFAVSFCVAQWLTARRFAPTGVRYLSFAIGVILVLLTPLEVLIVSCGMAGACL
ncbi:hypothetical protein [Dyella sp. ASV21]|jgi:hypothetical protein|uniref:hypothetical protein n=1 Tax=Dyella sp. ASV21 TaxID=2795114 RepID=UPI0018EBC486|nr:hypothetical protein [Dyella sp. ASV21]